MTRIALGESGGHGVDGLGDLAEFVGFRNVGASGEVACGDAIDYALEFEKRTAGAVREPERHGDRKSEREAERKERRFGKRAELSFDPIRFRLRDHGCNYFAGCIADGRVGSKIVAELIARKLLFDHGLREIER